MSCGRARAWMRGVLAVMLLCLLWLLLLLLVVLVGAVEGGLDRGVG